MNTSNDGLSIKNYQVHPAGNNLGIAFDTFFKCKYARLNKINDWNYISKKHLFNKRMDAFFVYILNSAFWSFIAISLI
jgi:hypothetical protein